MNKIYIKGLIKKKLLIRMFIILLLSLSLFIFLIAYKNNVDKKIYDEKNTLDLRTIKVSTKMDLAKYDDYIENYKCEEDKCTIIFKTYILRDEFLDKYKNNIEDYKKNIGMKSSYETLLNILKIGVIVIMVSLIICTISFIINYFSHIFKTIKLYHILGFSNIRCFLYLNLLFFIILETYSILAMSIIKLINSDYILIKDYLISFIIISSSCIGATLISKLYLKKG